MKYSLTTILFLLLNFISLILSQNPTEEFDLAPKGEAVIKNNKEASFKIKLTDSIESYLNYLDITLESVNNINPMIMISTTDNKCEINRLFTSIQFHDSIHIFLKKQQIPNKEFYICIKNRENMNQIDYIITIKNEQAAFLPYNHQGSYYVSDASTENMDVIFIKDENEYKTSSKISFWVKGKNIHKADMGGYFKGNVYDLGYVFYGDFKKTEKKLTIGSKIGDFITIGSTVITDGKIHEMKENSDEIMVASEEEVCLPIKFEQYVMHITGKIYTRKARTYFADQEGNEIIIDGQKQESIITNGILNDFNSIGLSSTDHKNGSYCLSSNSTTGDKLLIFSIQMTSNRNIHMVHSPLIPGEIRRHFLMKNEWAIFYGMKPKDGAEEVNLNLKSLKGFPEMYYTDCTTFPACFYTEESIKELDHPYPSNMMTVYSFYIQDKPEYKEYNSITAFQPLMIVFCAQGGKKKIFDEDSFCEFETSYFTNLDTINLYEDIGFSQYLLKGEKDNYKINLYGEDAELIYLDMMLFSGDADLKINNFTGEANKYYLSNKIFYSIHLNNNENLDFSIVANSPCFYMIQYQLIKIGVSDDINTIESGVNYITSKYFTNTDYVLSTKHIDLINYKYEFDQDYLVNFYSPNCKFEVFWVYNASENTTEKITAIDGNYIQKIINVKESPNYNNEMYTFYYSILGDDKSTYPNKFCIVYVSGLELSNSIQEWNNRAISLSEGVPHRYTFNRKYPFMFYSYYVSNQNKSLVLNFNLIDKGSFEVDIKINMVKFKNETIYRNTQFFIASNYLKGACTDQEVCPINIIVEMKELTEDLRVELIMHQIDGAPFYLEKNVVKQDIVQGNKVKHYYFDIAKEEYGDITLDFKRGSGNIYASVEPRIMTQPMNQSDWRGLYHFPMTNDESLKYKTYGKKIEITAKDTEKCSEGCYVLISIISNVNYYDSYDDETIPFRITINPRIMKTDTTVPSPLVKIDVNEFIIGDIVYGLPDNRKYDYYKITLPYDSENVLIDWQADSPLLIINVGDKRPTTAKDDAHFEFPAIGNDFVYKLNKTDILKNGCYDSNISLKGITLTIGIYSETNDSIQSSPYAFKIFLPHITDSQEKLVATEIIHIRSDQKVQCLPYNYNGKYICLFAVIFDDMDENSNLVLYPRNKAGSNINIYGQLVNSEPIERNNVNDIFNLFKDTFDNNNHKVTEKYVYLEGNEKTKSYFFILYPEDNSGSIMEVLSSTYLYTDDMNIYPNPSSAQIFAIGENKINLNFVTTKDLLLNIVCISGLGAFYWADEKDNGNKYLLEGYDDKMSLTTYTTDDETKLASLIVESSTFSQILKGGFIFYITFYPRNNIDQLKTERNTEFHYRTVKMPLYYYAPIKRLEDYTINFNFYDFSTKNKEIITYDTNLFNIWATIIPEKETFKARAELDYKPKFDSANIIKGVFDSTFGNIFFSQSEIERIYKDEKDIPNIFFSIEKEDNIKYDFTSLGFEINVFSDRKTSGDSPIPEGIFITGKLSQSKGKKLIYMIPCKKEKPFIRVEYAANSDFVNFVLSVNAESKITDEFKLKKEEVKGGRNLLTIQLDDNFFSVNNSLYFIVFSEEKNLDNKLDYFSFMYLTTENIENFWEFLEEDKRNVTLVINDNNYGISFYPIPGLKASYYIKAIYKDELIKGEKIDTIAISESKGKYMQISNPSYKENEQISFTFKIDKEVSYIKVMARFNFINQKLFYLYKPVDITKSDESNPADGENDSDKTFIYISIAVACVLVVIVIFLIVFTLIYNKHNKDLADQVNKISFVQSGADANEKEKVDGNLLLNDDEDSKLY